MNMSIPTTSMGKFFMRSINGIKAPIQILLTYDGMITHLPFNKDFWESCKSFPLPLRITVALSFHVFDLGSLLQDFLYILAIPKECVFNKQTLGWIKLLMTFVGRGEVRVFCGWKKPNFLTWQKMRHYYTLTKCAMFCHHCRKNKLLTF